MGWGVMGWNEMGLDGMGLGLRIGIGLFTLMQKMKFIVFTRS